MLPRYSVSLNLLLRTAYCRLVNTPDAAQRWPTPVDACVRVDMVVDSMACYKGKGTSCVMAPPIEGMEEVSPPPLCLFVQIRIQYRCHNYAVISHATTIPSPHFGLPTDLSGFFHGARGH